MSVYMHPNWQGKTFDTWFVELRRELSKLGVIMGDINKPLYIKYYLSLILPVDAAIFLHSEI